MKLQTKVCLVLLAGFITTYLGSALFQHFRSARALNRFAVQSREGEIRRQWEWVDRLENAIQAPLVDAMAAGEMDKFEKILAAQRTVPGLQEVSLFDRKGRSAYSSRKDASKRELPVEVKAAAFTKSDEIRLRPDGAFEVFRPLIARKACIECHTDWKQDEICGVLSTKFSGDALKSAEQSWTAFEQNIRKESAWTMMFTSVALIIVLVGLVAASIHYQVAVPLRRVANSVWTEAGNVRSTAEQVSETTETLASGASEQAASLEETSASLETMAATTRGNADNAQVVNDVAKKTKASAEAGVAVMEDVNVAMESIRAASADINSIIKTVNEIAFQTNLLALNAAVEAARSGAAGMGFAVVADEVRVLAQRSAVAAQESADKVATAIAKTNEGIVLNQKLAIGLNEIVESARKLDELAAAVAAASKDQNEGISQLNSAVEQMDKVTQTNAASAEENAAAAKELSGQAEVMKQSALDLLKLVNGDSTCEMQPVENSGGKFPGSHKRFEAKPDMSAREYSTVA